MASECLVLRPRGSLPTGRCPECEVLLRNVSARGRVKADATSLGCGVSGDPGELDSRTEKLLHDGVVPFIEQSVLERAESSVRVFFNKAASKFFGLRKTCSGTEALQNASKIPGFDWKPIS